MSRLELLENLPYFSGLPPDELRRVCESADEVAIPAGHLLLEEGTHGDAMYVIVEGEFEVTHRVEERDVVIGSARRGEVLGETSLLNDVPRTASARAVVDSRVAVISRETFHRLMRNAHAVLEMLKTVTDRLRNRESALRQAEKMAALGTMTAGLLHELNNPAAAVRRGVLQLGETFDAWRDAALQLAGLDSGVLESPGEPPVDALERADLEDEVAAWLEDRGVEEGWQLAPDLVARGWDVANLERFVAAAPDRDVEALIRLLALGGSVSALVGEVRMAAERMSQIVAAVKRYSRKDEAPIQNIDIHDGLEDTLVILRHKQGGVDVVRDYDPDLPRVEAYASELNQVWTNLIDNAYGAMDGKGTLTVRTLAELDRVVVEIADTGPGIAPEHLTHVFDPFFTTKPPGHGTGLGLHISYNLIAKHGGELSVRSRPGETVFQAWLPLRLPGSGAAAAGAESDGRAAAAERDGRADGDH